MYLRKGPKPSFRPKASAVWSQANSLSCELMDCPSSTSYGLPEASPKQHQSSKPQTCRIRNACCFCQEPWVMKALPKLASTRWLLCGRNPGAWLAPLEPVSGA